MPDRIRTAAEFRQLAKTISAAARRIEGIAIAIEKAGLSEVTVSVDQLFNSQRSGLVNAVRMAVLKVNSKLEGNNFDDEFREEEFLRAELDVEVQSREAESQPEPKTKPARKGKGAK